MANIKINTLYKGQPIECEVEPGDTLHLYTGSEWSDDVIISTHYPLRAFKISLPLHRVFISTEGALYILPTINSDMQEIVWGEGENQVKLHKLELGTKRGRNGEPG